MQLQKSQETDIIEEKIQTVNGDTLIKKYQQGQLLGKGGFAKCFQITNLETKKIMAAKFMPKSALIKNRSRQKLISEIKIHKSLHHTNIVKFEHVFEDEENVYILLELCPYQTLNELIKRRKRLSELETQCYTVQIVNALKYLHQNRIIHRDLKLGNLFIGDKMEIKVGDFGLATKLEFDGEKKRTICGTPNYIAPEILDAKVGHSYEVDIWSLGVIIYTLLIGKPPYETTDVKSTYKKIKQNIYSFPEHVSISDSSKSLIQLILQTEPSNRPSLDEILAHHFINNGGTIPRLLPVSTLQTAPNQSYLKQYAPSATNLKANQESLQINTEIFSSRLPKNSGLIKSGTSISLKNQYNTNGSISCQFTQPIKPQSQTKLELKETISVQKEQIKETNIDCNKNGIYVCQYVDYSTKYGLGYILSNGNYGVVFNDNTKILLQESNFYYIEKVDNQDVQKQYSLTEYPAEMQKKMTLLTHFKNYLEAEILKNNIVLAENRPNQQIVYLKKWMKTRHAIMFRLSNKVVQVQFTDKTEILLNSQEKLVSFLNKKAERSHYPLGEAMNSSNQEMTKRLKYTKEILTHLLKNNAKQEAE